MSGDSSMASSMYASMALLLCRAIFIMTSFGVFARASRLTPDLLMKCPVSFEGSTAAASSTNCTNLSASCCAAATTSTFVVKANGVSRLPTNGVENAAEEDLSESTFVRAFCLSTSSTATSKGQSKPWNLASSSEPQHLRVRLSSGMQNFGKQLEKFLGLVGG